MKKFKKGEKVKVKLSFWQRLNVFKSTLFWAPKEVTILKYHEEFLAWQTECPKGRIWMFIDEKLERYPWA